MTSDRFTCIVCYKQKPNDQKSNDEPVIYHLHIAPGFICQSCVEGIKRCQDREKVWKEDEAKRQHHE